MHGASCDSEKRLKKMAFSANCFLIIFSLLTDVTCVRQYSRRESQELGHVRHENGTIEWGPFPKSIIENSGRQKVIRSPSLDTTVNFARSIVNSVQTQDFPYDLLRRVIRGSYSEKEVLDYQTNVIVVTALGAVLVAAPLVVIVVYLVRKWRRGKAKTKKTSVRSPKLKSKHLKIIVFFGFLFMIINLMFILCVLVVSGQALSGALELNDVINDAMNDVIKYFDGLKEQYDFITVNTSQWLTHEVIAMDINETGPLLWQTVMVDFHDTVYGTMLSVADFDVRASKALSLLTGLESKMAATMGGVGGELDALLTNVHYNLTAAVADYTCFGCNGNCNGCQPIVPDDIFFMADFKMLPNLTANIASLSALLSRPIKDSVQSPEYFFTNEIGNIINRHPNITQAQNGLKKDVASYGSTWGSATRNIMFPNETSLWFDWMKPRFESFLSELEAKEIARFTFILLFCLLTLVTMGFTVGAMVVAERRGLMKNRTGREDFGLPRRILGWSILSALVLASCHLAMAAAGFYSGANLQKAVCEPGASLDIVRKVLDYPDTIPGHPGYFASSLFLGNGSLGPLKITDIFKACANGSNAYQSFQQELVVPDLRKDLQNYSRHFTDADTLFNMMRVDLNNVPLTPPDFIKWLDSFSDATSFNYTLYENMLNGFTISADLDNYANNLRVIYNTSFENGGPLEPSKSRLSIAADLLLEQKVNLVTFNGIKKRLADELVEFLATVTEIQTIADQAIKNLTSMEPTFHSLAVSAMNTSVDQYKTELFHLMDIAANESWSRVQNAGRCQQVSNAYDIVISSACDNYADYENASWLLLGHVTAFLFVWALIFSRVYRELSRELYSNIANIINEECERVIGIRSDEEYVDAPRKQINPAKTRLFITFPEEKENMTSAQKESETVHPTLSSTKSEFQNVGVLPASASPRTLSASVRTSTACDGFVNMACSLEDGLTVDDVDEC